MLGYQLIPRYSGGSPAWTKDGVLTARVVEQEKEAYLVALTGALGPELKRTAQEQELEGVVLLCLGSQHYSDQITGRDYGLMPYEAIRHYEQITCITKGKHAHYFFRRQGLCKLPARQASMGVVLRALEAKWQISWTSKEAEALWRTHIVV